MNEVIIKRTSREGQDPKMFRAYTRMAKPLGVSASTTGNDIYAVRSCATKAFYKVAPIGADFDEIETRVGLKNLRAGIWLATLQPK